jgi:hypothetical protein
MGEHDFLHPRYFPTSGLCENFIQVLFKPQARRVLASTLLRLAQRKCAIKTAPSKLMENDWSADADNINNPVISPCVVNK